MMVGVKIVYVMNCTEKTTGKGDYDKHCVRFGGCSNGYMMK